LALVGSELLDAPLPLLPMAPPLPVALPLAVLLESEAFLVLPRFFLSELGLSLALPALLPKLP
jgi:hypothetical protein